jgi:hypothetical protein
MAFFKSVFPNPSPAVVAGIATAGSVFAVYQLCLGPVSSAYASDANHPALESSRKKAGYTSFLLVSGMTLLTRDSTIGVLGFSSIIALEILYRHGIMTSPATGRIQAPDAADYMMAGQQYDGGDAAESDAA